MPAESPQHVPVLVDEVSQWLRPQPGHIIVDGTLGGGGHTRVLAEAVGKMGQIVAVDRDPLAVQRASETLLELPVRVAQANYSDMPELLTQLGINCVDGILLDLGLSSDQLRDAERGFSFQAEGPLDLRFDPTSGKPAWKLLERLSAEHLADIIYQYGEERHSRRIARAIVRRRKQAPIRTSVDLASIVRGCATRSPRSRIDPATRTFQALRIATNEELRWLEIGLRRLPQLLRPEGRMAVISFHSLEDRLVKQAFRANAELQVLTRRPVRPGDEEVSLNPRSRSARLRVAQKT